MIAVVRELRHLTAAAAGAGLVLVGCVGGDDGPATEVRSTNPDPVVGAAPEPHVEPSDTADPEPGQDLQGDLERYCEAHEVALAAIEDVLDPHGDVADGDAVVAVLTSLEAVTETVAADLRADAEPLHPRVEPLLEAAEAAATGAREALDADHDARAAYLAAIEDVLDPHGDVADGDALVAVLTSLEAVTETVAADLRADAEPLHPRVEPLLEAAEAAATGARKALDADHDARAAYLAEQLQGASYLQPLVDDPDLYTTVTEVEGCDGLPLGAVAVELRQRDDQRR